ncbi:ATP synthase F0 subunit B [Candidatus Falkowbacteria bacterium CG10_big_fil_rev_8_21_14_0_10_39_11]|uniref:ATP synthase subunit b n=1 Tax=Candidatus Falkowbacteria bacterium CG10_big_fil_rev_8_21_14_0_10_39_11 TaxID=1974565 RepID=A0A2H0V5P6_9BACT|nr:MAG: ATP synthase F0 subunit B [Candidatus Falkowbacteria bacterium CG10_big_fil_rev_8_21_14_0_10_39_11]
MDELIKTFHIDWRLIIAQAINFVIVFSVLYYFGIRPLMTIMTARTEKIEGGIKNAEVIEEKLQQAEKDKQKEINKGRKQGQELVVAAEKDSDLLRREKLEKTRLEADKIVTSAKQEIASERSKMVKDVKQELGNLVLLASNKITAQTLDEKKHEKLINQVIDELKQAEIKA